MQKKPTFRYQRIRDIREDNGYLQQDIADMLGLYLNTYRRYETGERTIPVNLLRKLSKIYNVSLDYLTEIEEETLQQGKKCMQEIEVSGINYAIQPLYRLLCYIKENKELYLLLLNNSTDDNFSSVMMQNTIDFLKYKSQNILPGSNNFSDYIFQYILSGCIHVIRSWINSSMTESPEEIAQLIYNASISVIETYKE